MLLISSLQTQQRRLIRATTCNIRCRSISTASSHSNNNNNTDSTSTNNNSPKYRPVYVAATKQHVGKTSVSLAIMSGLQKRFGQDRVGFIKPVGQQSVVYNSNNNNESHENNNESHENNSESQATTTTTTTTPCHIDKDAALMLQHFSALQTHLEPSWTSPVLIPPGYTKDYIDGAIPQEYHYNAIATALNHIQSASDIVLCEGTGHVAVGSIIQASNAQVAAWCGAAMVLVANGGIGNAFDELCLNYSVCQQYNVPIAGVVINKVRSDKYQQTRDYLSKLLQERWEGVPLLACIPDRPFLGCPALADLEKLLQGSIVSGKQHRLRHYRSQDIQLVATSLEVFLKHIRTSTGRTLYVCHASRNDILLGFLMEAVQLQQQRQQQQSTSTTTTTTSTTTTDNQWESAMVVTGCDTCPVSTLVLEIITSLPNAPPILLTGMHTDTVMEAMYHYTPKLNKADTHRVQAAVDHYEPYIDFDVLLQQCQVPSTSTTSTTTTNNNNPSGHAASVVL